MKPCILFACRILSLSFLFTVPGMTRTQAQTPKTTIYRSAAREDARTLHDLNNARLELQKIVVKYDKNNRGEYVFTCENHAFCNYIVEVSFSELENLQSDVPLPARMTVPPGTSRLFVLRKI